MVGMACVYARDNTVLNTHLAVAVATHATTKLSDVAAALGAVRPVVLAPQRLATAAVAVAAVVAAECARNTFRSSCSRCREPSRGDTPQVADAVPKRQRPRATTDDGVHGSVEATRGTVGCRQWQRRERLHVQRASEGPRVRRTVRQRRPPRRLHHEGVRAPPLRHKYPRNRQLCGDRAADVASTASGTATVGPQRVVRNRLQQHATTCTATALAPRPCNCHTRHTRHTVACDRRGGGSVDSTERGPGSRLRGESTDADRAPTCQPRASSTCERAWHRSLCFRRATVTLPPSWPAATS
jgi:hypothetical protein